jgi:hypothetical protein
MDTPIASMYRSPIVEKLAFEQTDRGYTIRAFYLTEPKGEALIHIRKGDLMIGNFLYPAYRIWNFSAHFKDIVDSEIDGNMIGYELADWNGF